MDDPEEYIKITHSRRSVDWRDSGIVIDDDLSFANLELQHYDLGPSNPQCLLNPRQLLEINSQASSNYNPIEDDDGDTILHLAVVGCSEEKVKHLIKICNINAINNLMHTPLHVATIANRVNIVQLLLNSGAKPDIPDRRGDTPLHLACKKGHAEIVDLILETVKSIESTNKATQTNQATKNYIETTNFDGLTCLHLACLNDRREIVDKLINGFDSNINCQDSRSGETILHKAIHQLNLGLVQFISSFHKHCNAKDYYGRTPQATINLLLKSNITPMEREALHSMGQLVRDRTIQCISSQGCCLFLEDNNDVDTSSSDYSDSD